MKNGLFHCHIGIVQRSIGDSAARRLAYQLCSEYRDPVLGRFDYTLKRREHIGSVILAPANTPDHLKNVKSFRDAISAREARVDAQEGYTLDVALPRDLPDNVRLAASAFILAPLIDAGMSAHIDIHVPRASDTKEQPHFHALISQREITKTGFGKKQRAWNEIFRRNGGRWVRATIANRMNRFCALIGLNIHFDPRSSVESGGLPPEPRFSRQHWIDWRKGKQPAGLKQLINSRREKRHLQTIVDEAEQELQMLVDALPEQEIIEGRFRYITSYGKSPSLDQGQLEIKIRNLAAEIHAKNRWLLTISTEICKITVGEFEFELRDGAIFPLSKKTEKSIGCLVKLAGALGFDAILIEGDSAFKTELIANTVGAVGQMIVLNALTDRSLQLTRKSDLWEFLRIIETLDCCNLVKEAMQRRSPSIEIEDFPDVRRSKMHKAESEVKLKNSMSDSRNSDLNANEDEETENLISKLFAP